MVARWISFLLLFSCWASDHILADAVECGKWFSKDCRAEDDIRYDDDVSNAIQDQNAVWTKMAGFWRITARVYDASGDPWGVGFINQSIPLFLNLGAYPYQVNGAIAYLNWTLAGSRSIRHRWVILLPAPEDFCNQTVPDGLANVYGEGECGVNGYSYSADNYATSTYEKDGTLQFLPTELTGAGIAQDTNDVTSGAYPINDQAVYVSTASNNLFTVESITCLNAECSRATAVSENFVRAPGGTTILVGTSTFQYERIADADTFVEAIQSEYEAQGVLPQDQAPVPITGQCISELIPPLFVPCPSEERWCSIDPECSESPYQEPDGTMKGGVIAAIVIFGCLVIFLVLFWVHRQRMVKQERRYRTHFATRVAQTIQVRASTKQLTPQALEKEFRRIDTDSNGKISKKDLEEFLSGKDGPMEERDFEALFSVLDTHGNGEVDFLEFCAFLAGCWEEVEETMAKPNLQRDSAYSAVARSLSVRQSKVGGVEDIKEEEEEKEE